MAVQTLERMPPQSLEAEVSLLGAMLLDNTVIDDVLQYVSKDSFYKTAHQELFQTIVELYDKNQAVDLVLLKAELERRGSLEKVGGLGYLMETLEVVPSIANAEYYANLIRDNAIKRDLIEAAVKIQKDVFENRGEVSALLDKAERRIFDIAEKKYADKTSHIADLISAAFKRLENMNDRKGRLTGLGTGLYDLDDLTCGFQPSPPVPTSVVTAGDRTYIANATANTQRQRIMARISRLFPSPSPCCAPCPPFLKACCPT